MGRYKNKQAPFVRRKHENGGLAQGRREAKGSGRGSKDLEDFLSWSVKPLGFSTVLLLGSYCILKVGGGSLFLNLFSEFLRSQPLSYNSLLPLYSVTQKNGFLEAAIFFSHVACNKRDFVVFSASRPPSSFQGFLSFWMYKRFSWCPPLTSWSQDRAGVSAASRSEGSARVGAAFTPKGCVAGVWLRLWVREWPRGWHLCVVVGI